MMSHTHLGVQSRQTNKQISAFILARMSRNFATDGMLRWRKNQKKKKKISKE